MDMMRLGVTIVLSCVVAGPQLTLADGAAKGRGVTRAAGNRGASRGTAGRGDGQSRGNAPRRGAAVKSAPPATATARRVAGRPPGSCAMACRSHRRP